MMADAATLLPATASIVIIGAGIVGCATAEHLTRLGWRDVVVVEQGPLPKAGGSTSHAPGLVFQTNGAKTMTNFARETVALYRSLHHDGLPAWQEVGSIEVATTPARWADLHRKLGWAQSWGLDASLLTPAAVTAKVPLVDPGAILGGYFVPSDGVAHGVRACTALIASATAAGATFYPRTTVTGIDVGDGQVTGVQTDRGPIATDRILIAAGIWSPRLGALAGVPLPLLPVEHQLAWTAPLAALAGQTNTHPILRHQDQDLYFRQRDDGYGVGSYAHEPVLVAPADILPHAASDDMPASRAFDAAAFAPALAEAVKLLPGLREATFTDAVNGMFSFTPDSYPLLGEARDVRGCWVAAAVWITHAGGVAKTVAEWLTTGQPSVDLHDCDVNRFEPHAATPAYLRERAAQQYREIYDVLHPLQRMARPRLLRTSPFLAPLLAERPALFESRGWEVTRWYEANASLLSDYPTATRAGWAGQFWSPIAVAEHLATRDRVALFDMSPLPKLHVSGPGATAFLERMTTNRIDRPLGSITYALMLNARGGIQSDITVTRLGPEAYQIGANGRLDLAWLQQHLAPGSAVQVRDVTAGLACLGVWGPRARDLVARLSADDLSNTAFPYYSARHIAIGEVPVLACRLSYVGELGWELYVSPEYGGRLLQLLREAGQDLGLIVAGRAAFETLRLEKGYRLWGTDISAEHTPDEAGLRFAVKPKKGDFLGREALLATRAEQPAGPAQRLVCLALDDPGTILMGKEPVLALPAETPVGYVTSAGLGASVGRSLAFAWVPAALATSGSPVGIVSFGDCHPATVIADPAFDPAGERLRG